MRYIHSGLLLWAWMATASAAPGQPEVRKDYMDVQTYTQGAMYGYLIEQCAQKAPARVPEMRQAEAAWRAENGEAVERGRAAVARLFPDIGRTEEERMAAMRRQYARIIDAGIAEDPDRACWRTLQSMRFAVPVEMSGTTLTDRNLRYDVFEQARVGVATLSGCRDFDVIETRVVSDIGSGAQRSIEEVWNFKGCGTEQAAKVRHGPAPGGGTNFVVSFDNPATARP